MKRDARAPAGPAAEGVPAEGKAAEGRAARGPAAERVAVALVHGIGTQDADFADHTLQLLRDRLRASGIDDDRWVGWGIHWQPALNAAQRSYYERASSAHELDWNELRVFVVHSLGDAAAYQRRPDGSRAGGGDDGAARSVHVSPSEPVPLRDNDPYQRVHAMLANSLHAQIAAHPTLAEAPLVVGAHSLGAHIFSNFAWDWGHDGGLAQRIFPELHDARRTPLERLQTLAGLVTFGANLPLFLFGLPDAVPLPFPAPTMRARYGVKCRWINLFDRDDPLGWPLRPVNEAFALAVDEDREVLLRGPAAPTPLSHNAYWSDPALIDALAQQVEALLGR